MIAVAIISYMFLGVIVATYLFDIHPEIDEGPTLLIFLLWPFVILFVTAIKIGLKLSRIMEEK